MAISSSVGGFGVTFLLLLLALEVVRGTPGVGSATDRFPGAAFLGAAVDFERPLVAGLLSFLALATTFVLPSPGLASPGSPSPGLGACLGGYLAVLPPRFCFGGSRGGVE